MKANTGISRRLAEEARDELRPILMILANGGRILQERYGKHAFGLGLVQLLAEQRKDELAVMLALWIATGRRSQLRIDARRFLAELSFLETDPAHG
jgi:hypothetical protein